MELNVENIVSDEGHPTGGTVSAVGLEIRWQEGPIPDNGVNGTTVEDVIAACIQRLNFYQQAVGGAFACVENERAIAQLEDAAHWLQHRTNDRIDRYAP